MFKQNSQQTIAAGYEVFENAKQKFEKGIELSVQELEINAASMQKLQDERATIDSKVGAAKKTLAKLTDFLA